MGEALAPDDQAGGRLHVKSETETEERHERDQPSRISLAGLLGGSCGGRHESSPAERGEGRKKCRKQKGKKARERKK